MAEHPRRGGHVRLVRLDEPAGAAPWGPPPRWAVERYQREARPALRSSGRWAGELALTRHVPDLTRHAQAAPLPGLRACLAGREDDRHHGLMVAAVAETIVLAEPEVRTIVTKAGTPFCLTVDGQTSEDGTVTVRDRDKIRQSVLEGLGWNIHRIWSTDWVADPDRELKIEVGQPDLLDQLFAQPIEAFFHLAAVPGVTAVRAASP